MRDDIYNWKSVQLGDVANFIDYRGKTPPKTTSGIPLITAKIVKNNTIQTPTEFISEGFYESWMTRGIPNYENVVFTTEAPLGEVAQIKTKEKLAFAQRVIVIQGKEGVLDDTFLFYALQHKPNKSHIEVRSTGTTVFGIKSAELKKVTIDIPTFSIQCKIATILRVIDDKIAENNKINHHLAARLVTDNSPDIRRGKRVSRRVERYALSLLLAWIRENIGLTTSSNLMSTSSLGSTTSNVLRMAVVILGTAEPTFIPTKSRLRTVKYTNFATFGRAI